MTEAARHENLGVRTLPKVLTQQYSSSESNSQYDTVGPMHYCYITMPD